jgi:hypothetical protein
LKEIMIIAKVNAHYKPSQYNHFEIHAEGKARHRDSIVLSPYAPAPRGFFANNFCAKAQLQPAENSFAVFHREATNRASVTLPPLRGAFSTRSNLLFGEKIIVPAPQLPARKPKA